jgi:hypothetical protein
MIIFSVIWCSIIITTAYIASIKKLSVGAYTVMAVFLGPLALLLVLAESSTASQNKSSGQIGSFKDALRELGSIQTVLSSLQNRVSSLEKSISMFTEKKESTVVETAIVPASTRRSEEVTKDSFEFTFGKYWLNRIGVVLFFLGVAFFINYTFAFLNAFAKITIGYLFAIAFFIWGSFLEKRKKYLKLSWGILGGAWAILFLVTYAMHYIDVTRIVSNSILELWLLLMVSLAAIVYNLKYKSWIITAITYLLAFITVGLGGIDYSTIIYWLLLVISICYLAKRLRWYQFLFFGICGSYLTYFFWIYPQVFNVFLVSKEFSIPVYQFQLNTGMLVTSWLLFSITLFLLKTEKKEELTYFIWGTLLNAVFFTGLWLNEIYRVRSSLVISWDIRFWSLFVLSTIYFLCGYLYRISSRPRFIVLNASIAFSLLAMAVIIRFPRLSVGYFWLLEMLILFIIGVYYKEIVYRVLAGFLSIVIMLRLLVVDLASSKYYAILFWEIKHNILIFTVAAFCFFFIGSLLKNKNIVKEIESMEVDLFSIFVGAGTLFLTVILGKEAGAKWLSSAWGIQGALLLLSGFLLKDKVYRICSLALFSLACLRLVFFDLAGLNTIYRIIAFIFIGMILLLASLVYSKYLTKRAT